MQVASLELCKTLFELSGWGYRYHYPKDGVHDITDEQWYWFEAKTTGSYWEAIKTDHNDRDPYDNRRPTATTHRMDLLAPAYDLGYLLRKLPPTLPYEDYKSMTGRLMIYPMTEYGYWVFEYQWGGRMASVKVSKNKRVTLSFRAKSPEDAACELAIELIKQKVIKL